MLNIQSTHFLFVESVEIGFKLGDQLPNKMLAEDCNQINDNEPEYVETPPTSSTHQVRPPWSTTRSMYNRMFRTERFLYYLVSTHLYLLHLMQFDLIDEFHQFFSA